MSIQKLRSFGTTTGNARAGRGANTNQPRRISSGLSRVAIGLTMPSKANLYIRLQISRDTFPSIAGGAPATNLSDQCCVPTRGPWDGPL